MNKESIKTLGAIKQCGEDMLKILVSGQVSAAIYSQKTSSMANLINSIQSLLPANIYQEYSDFFNSFYTFCNQCSNPDFLTVNVDIMASSLQLFTECMDDMIQHCLKKLRKCPCCHREVIYISESHNEEETYTCPHCGASGRDRLIISYLKKEKLPEASTETKLLQIAPNDVISKWISIKCPQIIYEMADLFMDDIAYPSDILSIGMVSDETYDVIICSHILECIPDDRKVLSELKRILKPDGKIIFLFPINQRPEKQFYIHSLDKSYFGDIVFFQCGLPDTSTLYLLTKTQDVSLYLAQEFPVDEKLCQDGPLVSVILPCYNHEQFVAEAIESVLNQSYKNIELLVMDDASTDNSVEIIKRYSSHFTKEIYFKENTGAKIDYLYAHAKGKYIALMHSDDIWDRDKLALQVAYMEKHDECGACLTWCLYVNEDMEDIMEEVNDHIFFQRNKNSYEWMQRFWLYGNALCNPSSLIRTEIAIEKPKYGRGCRQVPDLFKYIDIIQRTSLHIIPKVLIRMRRYQKDGHENTSARSNENDMRAAIETGCNWLCVIRDMDPDFFKHTFHNLMINPQANSEVEIQCEKYFLLLNHPNAFIQQSALYYYNEMYNTIEECLIEKYHYSRNDFFRDTISKGLGRVLLSK